MITPFPLLPLPPLLFTGLTYPYPIYRLLYYISNQQSTIFAIFNNSIMFLHVVNIEYYGFKAKDRTIEAFYSEISVIFS